ncbi:hypothetical protein ACP4OV_003388 [Aristida adscensionis]
MAPPQSPEDTVLAACKLRFAPITFAETSALLKEKVSHFRIKELKSVLHQLRLPKQGKKQELADKVIAALLDNQYEASKVCSFSPVVNIIEDTFRQMQDPTNTAAVSGSHIDSGHSVKPKKKPCGSDQLGMKYFGLAAKPCIDPECNVWQHVSCVIIPEKPGESIPPELSSCFYCEMCRISRADPFWITINHPLLPILLAPIAPDGSCTVEYTAKTFTLSRANREMLQKAEYDLQVWCMHVRVVSRQPTQKLGANGRDDGPLLTAYLRDGPMKISLSKNDSRTFCMGVRIVKRRSLEQVLSLVPKEQDGEKFNDALARVCRCVGGGTEADNADSDSDLEVVADSVSVNLRCPMTASRIRIAGRFKPCAHMGCFDLEAFIEMNQRSRKWQCPICLKNYSLDSIIIDPYFNRITSLIQGFGNDTSEIDVKPDGSWRVKGGAELKDLTQWHLPDGTLCSATDTRTKPEMSIVKHEIKEQPLSEEPGCRLKLGIRKNNNGHWEVSNKGDFELVPISDTVHAGQLENKNCVTLGSNIYDGDTEDGIHNSEPGESGHPVSHVHDLDSCPTDENVPSVPTEQDIIVLSDSEDDVTVLSPSAMNCDSALGTENPCPPNPRGMCKEQSGGFPNETPFLALNEGFGDLGLSFWEYPSSSQDEMFEPGTQVTNNPGEMQNHLGNHQSKHDTDSGGNLEVIAAAGTLEDGHDGVLQTSTSSEINGGMSQANLNDHTEACLAGHSDNLTSLSLSGADGSLINATNASRKRRSSGDESTGLDDSVLSSTNDDDLTREICRSPSSVPRRQRSVRPRSMIQSIASDLV